MREASSIGAALTPALSPRERGRGGADTAFSPPEEDALRSGRSLLPVGEGGQR